MVRHKLECTLYRSVGATLTSDTLVVYFQIFNRISITRICLFHFRIWNAYLASWLSRTSRADKLQDVLETARVFRIILKCRNFFFVLKASTAVRHTSIDGFRDYRRFTGKTSRSKYFRLTEVARWWRGCNV